MTLHKLNIALDSIGQNKNRKSVGSNEGHYQL